MRIIQKLFENCVFLSKKGIKEKSIDATKERKCVGLTVRTEKWERKEEIFKSLISH